MKTVFVGIKFKYEKKPVKIEYKVFESTIVFKKFKDNIYSIFINSNSFEDADKAISLLLSCCSVIYNYKLFDIDDISNRLYIEFCKEDISYSNIELDKGYTIHYDCFAAADMASKACANLNECLAIYKFQICKEKCDYYLNEWDYSDNNQILNIIERIKIANNIVLLFSILEELKFVLNNKRDILNKYTGPYHKKLSDKERYNILVSKYAILLNEKGIDPNKRLYWRISLNDSGYIDKNCLSNDIEGIEDDSSFAYKTIKEAVYELDYLRNHISAHSNSKDDKINKIEVKDLINSYILIRELLMNYFGIV